MEHWWVDTDPGVDDAWALLMMMGCDHIKVPGISVVGGNVGLTHTLANALRVVDRAPYAVPVYSGAARPLIGGLQSGCLRHEDTGASGFAAAPDRALS